MDIWKKVSTDCVHASSSSADHFNLVYIVYIRALDKLMHSSSDVKVMRCSWDGNLVKYCYMLLNLVNYFT